MADNAGGLSSNAYLFDQIQNVQQEMQQPPAIAPAADDDLENYTLGIVIQVREFASQKEAKDGVVKPNNFNLDREINFTTKSQFFQLLLAMVSEYFDKPGILEVCTQNPANNVFKFDPDWNQAAPRVFADLSRFVTMKNKKLQGLSLDPVNVEEKSLHIWARKWVESRRQVAASEALSRSLNLFCS